MAGSAHNQSAEDFRQILSVLARHKTDTHEQRKACARQLMWVMGKGRVLVSPAPATPRAQLTDEQILFIVSTQPCPRCHRPPGQPCVSANGFDLRTPHAGRRDAAQSA